MMLASCLVSLLLGLVATVRSGASALIDPPLFPFPPETGYITVLAEDNPDKNENEIYYWLVRAKNNPSTAPLMIWLDGGPGCAGTFGLFFNIGPYEVKDFSYDPTTGTYTGEKKADLRDTSWYENCNILFPDNPIGVGFSINQDQYLPRDGSQATAQFVVFFRNFLAKYPEFKDRDLVFTGASFGGHWAPYYAYALDKLGDPSIRITGLVLASAYLQSKKLSESYPHFSEVSKQYTMITPEILQESQKLTDLCSHLIDVHDNPMLASYPIDICDKA